MCWRRPLKSTFSSCGLWALIAAQQSFDISTRLNILVFRILAKNYTLTALFAPSRWLAFTGKPKRPIRDYYAIACVQPTEGNLSQYVYLIWHVKLHLSWDSDRDKSSALLCNPLLSIWNKFVLKFKLNLKGDAFLDSLTILTMWTWSLSHAQRVWSLCRRIRAGTELTWDYNYEVGSVEGKELLCCCGSTECRGRLLWVRHTVCSRHIHPDAELLYFAVLVLALLAVSPRTIVRGRGWWGGGTFSTPGFHLLFLSWAKYFIAVLSCVFSFFIHVTSFILF